MGQRDGRGHVVQRTQLDAARPEDARVVLKEVIDAVQRAARDGAEDIDGVSGLADGKAVGIRKVGGIVRVHHRQLRKAFGRCDIKFQLTGSERSDFRRGELRLFGHGQRNKRAGVLGTILDGGGNPKRRICRILRRGADFDQGQVVKVHHARTAAHEIIRPMRSGIRLLLAVGCDKLDFEALPFLGDILRGGRKLLGPKSQTGRKRRQAQIQIRVTAVSDLLRIGAQTVHIPLFEADRSVIQMLLTRKFFKIVLDDIAAADSVIGFEPVKAGVVCSAVVKVIARCLLRG